MSERWKPEDSKDYPFKKFAEMLRSWMKNPSSESELEKWYANRRTICRYFSE